MAQSFSRRSLFKGATLLGVGAGLGALPTAAHAGGGSGHAVVASHGPGAAARWIRTTYDVVAAEGLTPPAAARTYAHVCLAGYEAMLAGMPRHLSLAGQITGLTGLPAAQRQLPLDWPLVFAAASATVLRLSFPAASDTARAHIDAAESDEVAARHRAGVAPAVHAASRAHGAAVGRALMAWAVLDGHAEALRRPYTPPTGEAMWVPTPPNFGTAIEPYCADVRPMVLRTTDEVAPAPPVPFSTVEGSPFWQEADVTYQQSKRNGDEERDIARFWTDNPRFSGLPAGHWMSIVVQVAEQRRLPLDRTAEALVRTAVALHDAFLSCWTWKYRHNLLRPVTYVQRYLDPTWSTWVNTPQFPEHTSGHSVASRAAATVLTDLLGDVRFDDTTLATTAGIARRTRTFRSFTAAADMAAQSRLYGGIHYPAGIELGKAQGDRVGELVVARLRTRR